MTTTERIFSNRYVAERLIARGGMAEVYLAHDNLLDRRVALKVLFPEYARDPSFVERFRREAQAAANLNDKNIVGIYDWGQEDGTYFIVMEYVDGRSLREILNEDGPMPARNAAEIGTEIASALAVAHSKGVVHRDVKPGNVLITASGIVKVTDFGIARADTSEQLTKVGNVMGTATYFSPEQAQGLPVDGRSDVYSLGVVLYEMVAGVTPFQGDNPVAVAYKHVREAPMALDERVPDVHADFATIVGRCLQKDPAARYASAADLEADLHRFVNGQPLATAPVTAMVTQVEAATTTTPVAAAGAAYAAGAATQAVPAVQAARTPQDTDKTNKRVVASILVALAIILGIVIIILAFVLTGDSGRGSGPVPNVVGQSFDSAKTNLEKAGFKVTRDDVASETVPIGQVIAQKPDAGTVLKKGGSVTLSVSAGPGDATVPNVVGQSVDNATTLLTNAGFKIAKLEQPSDQVPVGLVISTDPTAGTKSTKGATVTITVSTGAEKVAVPNVVGQSESSAANQLGQAGFNAKFSTQPSSTVALGKVISTDPAAGTQVAKGSTVNVVVSSGPEKVPVPGVVGDTQAAATTTLSNAGFTVTVNTQATTPANAGKVLSQDPSAGTLAAKGSTVTIVVGITVPPST